MKSFRSKASRFFRHSPSSDEKTAITEHSEPVFSAGIDMDTDPVLTDIDPAVDAAIDATLRASVHAKSKKLNWLFGTEADKVEKSLPEPRFRFTPPNSPELSENDTSGHPPADEFDHLPEYDDSDDEITALPQLPSLTLHQNRASGSSTLARAIERNDPDVPSPLSPRLRRKDNILGSSNGSERPPTPPSQVEAKSVESPTYSLFPDTSQNHGNGSTYSLFHNTVRDSVHGSTVGLLNEYNRKETPQFLSATPEPSRTKGGFTGLARLKKSYANLKSKSPHFFNKEHVPSPPPPPPPPQISVDIDMGTLFGPTKDVAVSKPAKKKVTKPLTKSVTKAAIKPSLKSPSTPLLTRPSTAAASKTAPQVRTLGISRPQPLPSSPSLFNHPNFSVPTVIPARPHTAVSTAPSRPLRPQSLGHDTVSFMQDPASRMHLVRQLNDDGTVVTRVQREPMHTIESRLGLPTGFAPPRRDSQVLASPLAAQVPEHTSLRESSGVDIPFRYSQYEEGHGKGKERASVESKGKGKQSVSVAVEEDAASIYSQEQKSSTEDKKERASDVDKVECACACGATNCGGSSIAVASTTAASTVVVEEEGDDTPPIERYSAEQEGIWVLEKKVSREEGGGMVFRHASGAFHYVPNV
ncbi:uncharacterized protein yc1106_03149 [Curvularia clavata]|uniref:Uncharacterized protein n=1 Tax=Curvularia clavata TaxID=95742 RepID=A0A9Q8Z666_CURCL|nr:uncharacterized protein yc1106_03149 [Curvularia clavata]